MCSTSLRSKRYLATVASVASLLTRRCVVATKFTTSDISHIVYIYYQNYSLSSINTSLSSYDLLLLYFVIIEVISLYYREYMFDSMPFYLLTNTFK